MPIVNEDILISLAIERESRGRYREGLAKPKKRDKLLDRLNHAPPLDPCYTKWYSTFDKAIREISVDPKAKVYILSAEEKIDGIYMSYQNAVSDVPFYDWGTIICISPTLAVYYGECGERAAVIKKSVK